MTGCCNAGARDGGWSRQRSESGAAHWRLRHARLGTAAEPTGGRPHRPARRRLSAISNPASDIGVTATTITVGVLVSRTSPLGPDVFSGSYYGAMAYFETLNAQGGINGRKIKVISATTPAAEAATSAASTS